MYEFTNFTYSYTYVSDLNTEIPMNINLGGSASYISGSIGTPYCPSNGPEPATSAILTDVNGFYRIAFTAEDGGYGIAQMEEFNTGAIQPKYDVLSVIYAPPGGGASNQSYVDYTGTTEVGTDNSMSSSFQNSSSITQSAGLLGISSSLSTTETQETDTLSSISVTQSTSVSDKYPGSQPASSAIGLDHDNDVILLWINPVLDCVDEPAWSYEPTYGNAIQCIEFDPNAASGNPNEQATEVLQLAVGWLNGDYPIPTNVSTVLAADGITSADYPTILASDPYGNCAASISCVQLIGITAGRFQDALVPVNFENDGNQTLYTLTYTTTSSQGTDSSNTYSVSYTTQASENFQSVLSLMLKNQTTLTWTNKWNATTTSMVGQSAAANIAEPNAGSGYDGPIGFEIYKDNTYGSFMFYPTQ